MLPTASRGLYAALEQVSAPHRGVRDNARLLLSCSQRLFVPLCAAHCSYIYGVGVADNPMFFGGKSSSLMRCFAKTEICEQVLDSGSDPIQSLGPVSVAQSGCVRLLSQEPLNVRKIRTRMNRERTPVNAASTAAEQRSAKRLWRFAMSLSLKRGSAGASPPGMRNSSCRAKRLLGQADAEDFRVVADIHVLAGKGGMRPGAVDDVGTRLFVVTLRRQPRQNQIPFGIEDNHAIRVT